MVGVRCAVIAIQMTGRTIGWCTCETVVGVALSTRDADVSSRQGKPGSGVMVKFGSSPLRGRMASLTRSGKTGCNVVWICGPVKVWEMARGAVLSSPREPVIHMTLLTAYVDVSTCERKARC